MLTLLLVFLLAAGKLGGRRDDSLLLGGVMVNAFCGALIMFLISIPEAATRALPWAERLQKAEPQQVQKATPQQVQKAKPQQVQEVKPQQIKKTSRIEIAVGNSIYTTPAC